MEIKTDKTKERRKESMGVRKEERKARKEKGKEGKIYFFSQRPSCRLQELVA